MSYKVYALFNNEKNLESVIDELTRIKNDVEMQVVRSDEATEYEVAPAAPTGVYPNAVLINGDEEYLEGLSDDLKDFIRQQLARGSFLLATEVDNENEGKMMSVIRESAARVITESGTLNVSNLVTSSEDPVDILNQLIALCLDGVEGYRAAAERTESTPFKTLFLEYAQQRETFAKELQSAVEELGGNPADSSTWLGSLHKGWLHFRSILSLKNEEHVILAEARRGEEAVKEAYREAFAGDLPPSVRPIIRQQLSEINLSFDRMNALASVTE